MLKTISGIAAFVLTFGVSVSLVGLLFGFTGLGTPAYEAGNNYSVSYTITEFLRQDVRNGNFRDREIRRQLSERFSYGSEPGELYVEGYSQAVHEYYKASSAMNDASLPADLKYAWRKHMDAWKAHDDLINTDDFAEEDAFFVRYRESSREVNETWYQVLRIAERYGANTRGLY